jgi:hypothetical protein
VEFLICGDINTGYLTERKEKRRKEKEKKEKKKRKTSLIINNIQSVFFILGDSPASEFYVLTFSEHTVSSIFIGGVSRKNN